MNGPFDHFVELVEGLSKLGVKQHVIVRDPAIARRLEQCDGVTLGQTVNAAVTAYCLMPQLPLVHVHDEASAHAGLLLTLTRSIPYVATRRCESPPDDNPIIRSVYRRAVSLICPTKRAAAAVTGQGLGVPVDVIPMISSSDANNKQRSSEKVAADHLRVYRRALDIRQIPALLL